MEVYFKNICYFVSCKPYSGRLIESSLMDRNHFSTYRVVAESYKRDERCRPSSKRPHHHSSKGLGAHLEHSPYKESVVRQGKRLHINVLELKAVSLALQRFKNQCQNQTVLVARDNKTVVAYINKEGGTHSLLWKLMA